MKKTIIVIFILTFTFIISCNSPFFTKNENCCLTIFFPEPYESHKILSSPKSHLWKLRWYTKNGEIKETQTNKKSIIMDIEKDSFTPIIAFCETSEDITFLNSFHPAGGIFPHNTTSKLNKCELVLTWSNGLAALLAEKVLTNARGGFSDAYLIASSTNWLKICNKISSFDYPNLLDLERACKGVLSGSLTSSHFKTEKTMNVEIPTEAFSQALDQKYNKLLLYPINPFYKSIKINLSNTSDFYNLDLPEGLTYYITKLGYFTVHVNNFKLHNLYFSEF